VDGVRGAPLTLLVELIRKVALSQESVSLIQMLDDGKFDCYAYYNQGDDIKCKKFCACWGLMIKLRAYFAVGFFGALGSFRACITLF